MMEDDNTGGCIVGNPLSRGETAENRAVSGACLDSKNVSSIANGSPVCLSFLVFAEEASPIDDEWESQEADVWCLYDDGDGEGVDHTATLGKLETRKYQKVWRKGDFKDHSIASTISNALRNLQILDLKACYNLETLPSEINRLLSSLIWMVSESLRIRHRQQPAAEAISANTRDHINKPKPAEKSDDGVVVPGTQNAAHSNNQLQKKFSDGGWRQH
nr:hypothetical protein Iba_chr09fCG4000 [Ipomoea batatas]